MSDVVLESTLTCPACGYAERGDDADQRLPVLLVLPGLRRAQQAEGRRLLRVLQLRLAVPCPPVQQSRRGCA